MTRRPDYEQLYDAIRLWYDFWETQGTPIDPIKWATGIHLMRRQFAILLGAPPYDTDEEGTGIDKTSD